MPSEDGLGDPVVPTLGVVYNDLHVWRQPHIKGGHVGRVDDQVWLALLTHDGLAAEDAGVLELQLGHEGPAAAAAAAPPQPGHERPAHTPAAAPASAHIERGIVSTPHTRQQQLHSPLINSLPHLK